MATDSAPKERRLVIFGREDIARHYAREHGLSPGQWIHAADRYRVIGLRPEDFMAVILHAPNDDAVTEWRLRGGTFT